MIRKCLTGVLLAVVVFLAAGFLKEAVFYNPLAPAKKPVYTGEGKPEKPNKGFSAGWNKAIYARDLFSKERGYVPPPPPPPPPSGPPPPPPPPPKPDFKLRGIVMENGKQMAIIETRQGIFGVKVGDTLDQAELTKIEDKQAVFRFYGEDMVLNMEKIRTIKR